MKAAPHGCIAAGLIALGLLASACGGGSTPGVASLSANAASSSNSSNSSSGSSSNEQQDGLKFSQCMRAHGVTNFPDPGSDGGISINSMSGLDPNSPAFQTAQKACQGLLPKPSPQQIQQAEQNALKFSECMRSHGVSNFPDPQFHSSGGNIGIKISAGVGGGLDPNSPTYQAAQSACGKLLHLPGGGPKQIGGSESGSGQSVFVG
jgi:hypothetical protein